jgi:D-3-phosphoglycerate dehydrogenase
MTETPAFRVVITDCEHGSIDPEIEVLSAINARVEWHNCRTEQDVIDVAADADGLIIGYAPITARVLDALGRTPYGVLRCRIVSRYGIGVDMVDIPAATRHGVAVTNVPDYCLDEVADHTMALLLALARKLLALDHAVRDGRAVKEGHWNTVEVAGPIYRLSKQTLGIIGLGQIGRRVARRAQAFGMQVIVAFDPAVRSEAASELGVTMQPLEAVLSQADYLSLHVPLTEDTRHLLNADRLALMKPTAVIINTTRGAVIEEAALVAALQHGRLAGAGLDVYEREPISPDNPLRTMENVVLSSHAAWYSEDALRDMKIKAAQAVADVLQGQVPRAILNPSVLGAGNAK